MSKFVLVFKKLLRYAITIFAFTIFAGGLYIGLVDDPTYSVVEHEPLEETDGDPRNQARTYTTFPEWYIVYSAEEYAAFLTAGNVPSDFPFFAAIKQYNEIETAVIKQVGGTSEIDETTKTVLDTIGTSFALENTTKGLYEKTIGRLSYWINFGVLTSEDQYIATSANDYAQFLFHTPWYSFTYQDALLGMWQSYGLSSVSPRGLERRLAFSIGCILKGTFGRTIHAVSQSSYGGAGQTTYVEVMNVSPEIVTALFNVELYPVSGQEHITVLLPRYRGFTAPFLELLKSGARVISIQGHNRIAFSVVTDVDSDCEYLTNNQIFAFPILTQPGIARYVLETGVEEIHNVLNALQACSIEIEHFYDY